MDMSLWPHFLARRVYTVVMTCPEKHKQFKLFDLISNSAP